MTPPLDVLVVGAGPTGLALALQLHAWKVPFRIVDRAPGPARESRAPAIQPRTLEALAGYGVTEELIARGNPARHLRLHLSGRAVAVPLFDTGLADTAHPFLLFLPQAETERVLAACLSARDVPVERGTELTALERKGSYAVCRLRRADGTDEAVTARYVVGCDGAHSAVRSLAGIGFEGYAYPQTFLLADLTVDGLPPGVLNTFVTGDGVLVFFPLGSPAPWRMIAIRPPGTPGDTVPLPLLQEIADRYTGGRVALRDPVWAAAFRVHNRGAARYRSGPCFLAGDAAHIHSPAGAQGMNTGIQDALNLGWKLALVCRGAAPAALLDTYEAERAPVGHGVRRLTDAAFTLLTGGNPLLRLGRARLAPLLAPLAGRAPALRGRVFRRVAELGIHYRRSPLSAGGPRPPGGGPRAGDRLPDLPRGLQARTAAPAWHLLLSGPPHRWPDERLAPLLAGREELIAVHRLGDRGPWRGTAHALVRPDGHLGYVARGTRTGGLCAYAARWLPAPPQARRG
jgi:2-polyprenyl-6-methoxyphenol hydroxylase-like FAD-dependent oxidoreductase